MKYRALSALCLVGSLCAVIGLAADSGAKKSSQSHLRIAPTGNLQVGIPGELLAEPIAVFTLPGTAVRFFSPDLGLLEESGGREAILVADERGRAQAHVRLGSNLGRYTVVAELVGQDGPSVSFHFRAIAPAAMEARRAELGLATNGGAR
jgi:hypothetical protein